MEVLRGWVELFERVELLSRAITSIAGCIKHVYVDVYTYIYIYMYAHICACMCIYIYTVGRVCVDKNMKT